MFNNEPSENDVQVDTPEAALSPGASSNSQPQAIGSSMLMIGAVPLVLFVVAVVLAFVGAPAVIGAVLLLIGAVGFFVMWKKAQGALSSNLHALRDEALAVANHDLPQLGNALSTGESVAGLSNQRTSVKFPDPEFNEVATSLTAVRNSAAGIGDNVAELQSGISNTYVNLARRNQALVDRQLEAIDTLEAEERDSDRLALLYRVDHLATRMNRNAAGLLVLADAKTPERHSAAMALREVLRVAIGEVEDYRRIVPISLDEMSVAGAKAQEMAHLLAELMENAAQHSPPGTAVDVTGALDPTSGDYTITILDHGTGMSDDQLAGINTMLATPPTSTLTISHSIGLQVVSRIAHKLGIAVSLKTGEDNGIISTVTIPASVVAMWGQVVPGSAAAPAAAPAVARPVAPAPAPAPEVVTPAPEAVAPTPEAPTISPEASAGIAGMTAFAGGSATEVAPPTIPDVTVKPPSSVPDLAAAPSVAPATEESAGGTFPTIGDGHSKDEGRPLESLLDPSSDGADESFQMPAPTPVAETPTAAPTEAASDSGETEPEVFTPGNSTFTMPSESTPETPASTEAVTAKIETQPAPAEPAPSADSTPKPAAAVAAAAASSVAVADAPAETPSAPEPGKLKSGLTKRTRSATPSAPPADLEVMRTAPSQRSPDQVKSMLSRYKSGLERGRGPAETDGE